MHYEPQGQLLGQPCDEAIFLVPDDGAGSAQRLCQSRASCQRHPFCAGVSGPLRRQHDDDLRAGSEGGSGRRVKPVGFVNQPVCLHGCNRRNTVGSQHIWQAIVNVCFWTSNLNFCSSTWLSTCVLQFVSLIVCRKPQAVERPVC